MTERGEESPCFDDRNRQDGGARQACDAYSRAVESAAALRWRWDGAGPTVRDKRASQRICLASDRCNVNIPTDSRGRTESRFISDGQGRRNPRDLAPRPISARGSIVAWTSKDASWHDRGGEIEREIMSERSSSPLLPMPSTSRGVSWTRSASLRPPRRACPHHGQTVSVAVWHYRLELDRLQSWTAKRATS